MIVIVPTTEDAEWILELLQELHDAGGDIWELSATALRNTSVVAIDRLRQKLDWADVSTVRLDNLPRSEIQDKRKKTTAAFQQRVTHVLLEAQKAADAAGVLFLTAARRTDDGRHVADVSGWADLMVCGSRTPLVSALMELKKTRARPGVGHIIQLSRGREWAHEQALSVSEAAANAAKEVFERHFPDELFFVYSNWD